MKRAIKTHDELFSYYLGNASPNVIKSWLDIPQFMRLHMFIHGEVHRKLK